MRPRLTINSLFVAAILCLSVFAQTKPSSPISVDRQRIETITRKLTSAEFNGRAFKTEGGRKAAEYIAGLFREIGLKPAAGRSDFFQPMAGGGQNVIGMIEGRDPARKNEYVVIGAHYDAFGGGFVGAMNNAAGVAVMIEVARAFAANQPPRSVLLIAFDGGTQNHAGAKFYAEHPLPAIEQTSAAILLSGFGGGMSEKSSDTLSAIGAESSPELSAALAKHRNGAAHLALLGADAAKWPGGEQYQFNLKQVPSVVVTNGVHYAYNSKADAPNRVNYPALEKHASSLIQIVAEIAGQPKKFARQTAPVYDADEATEWSRLLTALRENVLKSPENEAGQKRIDEVLFELKRFEGRAVLEAKARAAVILPAANLCFYIANPNGVEFTSLNNQARAHEQRGEKQQAIATYQKLLKFIAEEYARDDRTIKEIRERLAKLEQQKE